MGKSWKGCEISSSTWSMSYTRNKPTHAWAIGNHLQPNILSLTLLKVEHGCQLLIDRKFSVERRLFTKERRAIVKTTHTKNDDRRRFWPRCSQCIDAISDMPVDSMTRSGADCFMQTVVQERRRHLRRRWETVACGSCSESRLRRCFWWEQIDRHSAKRTMCMHRRHPWESVRIQSAVVSVLLLRNTECIDD